MHVLWLSKSWLALLIRSCYIEAWGRYRCRLVNAVYNKASIKKKMECLSESVKRMINSVFFHFICKIAFE